MPPPSPQPPTHCTAVLLPRLPDSLGRLSRFPHASWEGVWSSELGARVSPVGFDLGCLCLVELKIDLGFSPLWLDRASLDLPCVGIYAIRICAKGFFCVYRISQIFGRAANVTLGWGWGRGGEGYILVIIRYMPSGYEKIEAVDSIIRSDSSRSKQKQQLERAFGS